MNIVRMVLGIALVIAFLGISAREAFACPHGYGVCRYGIYYVCYNGRWIPTGRCLRPDVAEPPRVSSLLSPMGPRRPPHEIAELPFSPRDNGNGPPSAAARVPATAPQIRDDE